MTKNPKLTDSALVLLSAASTRTHHMVLPAPTSVRARGKALEKVLTKLLRLGLVEECAAQSPDQAWRHDEDGRGVGLRITRPGRDALGLADGSEAATGTATPNAGSGDDALDGDGPRTTRSTRRNRKAASARHTSPPAPGIKPGTKQARLIGRLRRRQGATVSDLARLLGWQPHTVRAALTGLRKKGLEVTGTKTDRGTTIYRVVLPENVADDAA